MSISNLVDDRPIRKKSEIEKCHLNADDCQFLDGNGNCRAEWCIFEELPKMINPKISISCYICGATKTVSAYSGERGYVCPSCASQIRMLFAIH